MAIPENAARNADGSLQNPAAWGISTGGNGGGPQPGSYDPNNAPQVNWDALNQSGFGGLYNGMQGGEMDQILANSRKNFERTGVVDSNLSGYLNNRDTARQMGLTGANQELDMNNLFGGLGDMQNLAFGPDKQGVNFQDTGANATQNIARVMQALGGGGYQNLGESMGGFNGTPNYGIVGPQSVRGIQEMFLRNGLNGGLGMLSASVPNGRFEGQNPASTRFDQTNFNYAGPRTVTPPAGAATTPGAPVNPTQPGAPTPPPGQPGMNATTGYGVNGPQASSAAPSAQGGMPQPPAWNPNDPVGSTQKLIQFQQQMQQWATNAYGGGGNSQSGGQTPIDNGAEMFQSGGGGVRGAGSANPRYTAPQTGGGDSPYQGPSMSNPYQGGNPFQGGSASNPWTGGYQVPSTNPSTGPGTPYNNGTPMANPTGPATGGGVRNPGTPSTPDNSGRTDSGAWGGRRSNNWLWGM